METATTLPRPDVLEHQSRTGTDQIATKVEKLVRSAKGIDKLDANSMDLLISQLNADDAGVIAPMAFNKKVAAILLGEGHEQVLDETFTHVIEYVSRTTDPGSRQSAVALLTNPLFAKQIWGSSYEQHVRKILEIIVTDFEHGQKHSHRNGR